MLYGFNNLADTCILYVITGILRYRESSSSAYPPWSFPCRCTDGCNTDNGDCLNGGTCIPDIPVGYTWSGQACRYGAPDHSKFILLIKIIKVIYPLII